MSGMGAYRVGGRWNSPGRHVVYASAHLSLAMLELLVHIDDAEAFRRRPHVYHSVRFTRQDVALLEERDLPRGWDARPETRASQVVGDEWIDTKPAPVLAVPSVIVPPELRYDEAYLTYLIDPGHPAFATAVEVGPVRDLAWDPRLNG
jgi:RES domain-containing protein